MPHRACRSLHGCRNPWALPPRTTCRWTPALLRGAWRSRGHVGSLGQDGPLHAPPDLRKEVDDLLLLYALNGVADAAAAKAIAELYSPRG